MMPSLLVFLATAKQAVRSSVLRKQLEEGGGLRNEAQGPLQLPRHRSSSSSAEEKETALTMALQFWAQAILDTRYLIAEGSSRRARSTPRNGRDRTGRDASIAKVRQSNCRLRLQTPAVCKKMVVKGTGEGEGSGDVVLSDLKPCWAQCCMITSCYCVFPDCIGCGESRI
jgi:hypothetical protein